MGRSCLSSSEQCGTSVKGARSRSAKSWHGASTGPTVGVGGAVVPGCASNAPLIFGLSSTYSKGSSGEASCRSEACLARPAEWRSAGVRAGAGFASDESRRRSPSSQERPSVCVYITRARPARSWPCALVSVLAHKARSRHSIDTQHSCPASVPGIPNPSMNNKIARRQI